MKNTLQLILAVLFSFIAFSVLSQDTIMYNIGKFGATLDLAKKERKLVFTYVRQEQSADCKRTESEICKNENLIEMFNRTYICHKLNAGQKESEQIISKHKITRYPSFLFIDPYTDSTYIIHGTYESIDELFILSDRLGGMLEETKSLKAQFNSGNRKNDFLDIYCSRMYSRNLLDSTAINEYFRVEDYESFYFDDYSNDDMLYVAEKNRQINKYIIYKSKVMGSYYSTAFDFLFKYRFIPTDGLTTEEMTAKIIYITQYEIELALKLKAKQRFEKALNFIVEFENSGKYSIVEDGDTTVVINTIDLVKNYVINFNLFSGKKLSELETEQEYIKALWNNHHKLAEQALHICKTTDDKLRMKTALTWVNRAKELNDFYFHTTYVRAFLLYKLEDYDAALKESEYASLIALEMTEDDSENNALREKIKIKISK